MGTTETDCESENLFFINYTIAQWHETNTDLAYQNSKTPAKLLSEVKQLTGELKYKFHKIHNPI